MQINSKGVSVVTFPANKITVFAESPSEAVFVAYKRALQQLITNDIKQIKGQRGDLNTKNKKRFVIKINSGCGGAASHAVNKIKPRGAAVKNLIKPQAKPKKKTLTFSAASTPHRPEPKSLQGCGKQQSAQHCG